MKYNTIREATEAWVNGFNAIPTEMIGQLVENYPDEWEEITDPVIGDEVYVYNLDDEWDTSEHHGIISNMTKPDGIYLITLDDGVSIQIGKENFDIERGELLPMWGTMWSFGSNVDNWWLEEGNGVQKMSECGFHVYYHEKFGYFFSINGYGYSFMDEHFIPLYKARGLHWHKEEGDE